MKHIAGTIWGVPSFAFAFNHHLSPLFSYVAAGGITFATCHTSLFVLLTVIVVMPCHAYPLPGRAHISLKNYQPFDADLLGVRETKTKMHGDHTFLGFSIWSLLLA